MAKTENVKMDGVVEEALGNGLFKVKVATNGTDHFVQCRVGGKMNMNQIRVLPGDKVAIECSPYDLTKGRITYRHKE